MTGRIFDIQRFSIHDGPGIRTTVFLKGCPMRCAWCHNPESISTDIQLAFYAGRCTGCGRCLEVCSNGAIIRPDTHIDRERCAVCGECARKCPSDARQLIGRDASVDEVLDVVLRDVPFYDTSGGGVTISGGEPFMQYDYSLALMSAFKTAGLHTAIETCGLTTQDRLAEMGRVTDLFLYDLKVIDPDKHRTLCGADNAIILANARFLAKTGVEIIYRTPVVPGCNDSPEDIRLLGEFVLSLPGNRKLELLKYHRIGSGKYEALGMDYTLADVDADPDLDDCRLTLSNMGVEIIA